ncbi:hypothetical protein IJL65_02005 [bacterium]|nr:hypothetical protein [bacterium]
MSLQTVTIFFNIPPVTESHLAGVHPETVPLNTFNFVYVHKAHKKRYQIESSLTIHSRDKSEKFFVVIVSKVSSITQYPESSVATSKEGFNTPVVLGIQT